jgi:prepilin-type N-terminal cleavage/methylation domain-containing protein
MFSRSPHRNSSHRCLPGLNGTNQESGFTLLEISIVLTIIGLVIGGVVVGGELIHGAQLQRVMREKTQLVAAITTFDLKYNALPGDMPNATQLWGYAWMPCSTGTGFTSTATCDGDGNRHVDAITVTTRETITFWQHLANAGLVFPLTNPGDFGTQPTVNGTQVLVPGFNIPQSSYPGAGYAVVYIGANADLGTVTRCDPATGSGQDFAPEQCRHNLIVFAGTTGGPWWAWGLQVSGGGIRCDDIKEMDNKYDDGMPYTGAMQLASAAAASYLCASGGYPTGIYHPITSDYQASPRVLVFPYEIDPKEGQ